MAQEIEILHGYVENLQRSTSVSHSRNSDGRSSSTTTHNCIFDIDGERIQ